MDEIQEPLPHWSIGTTTDPTEEGAALPTRDGRVCGNAVLVQELGETAYGCLYLVVTDAGNSMRLLEREINSMFYQPKWKMNVQEHMGYKLWKQRVEARIATRT